MGKTKSEHERILDLEDHFMAMSDSIQELSEGRGEIQNAFPASVPISMMGIGSFSAKKEPDWECTANDEATPVNCEKCRRYKITNSGTRSVTVTAHPSDKATDIPGGRSAYVECKKITIKTNAGSSQGFCDTA